MNSRVGGMRRPLLLFLLSLLQTEQLQLCGAVPGSRGERVHIKVHMPEVVRQHTHFHKVYKHVPHPFPVLGATKKLPPWPQQQTGPGSGAGSGAGASPGAGKAHVSLLGYTTSASGSGGMAPSLMQLMSTLPATDAAQPHAMNMPMGTGTGMGMGMGMGMGLGGMSMGLGMPTLAPNYGPALFDNLNQETTPKDAPEVLKTTAAATTTSTTAKRLKPKAKDGDAKQRQQQLLQQLFMPNVMAAIGATADATKDDTDEEDPFEMGAAHGGGNLESNTLLNSEFLAALQRQYLDQFGATVAAGGNPMLKRHNKRKKYGRQGGSGRSKYRRPQSNYIYEELHEPEEQQRESAASPYGLGNYYGSDQQEGGAASFYDDAEDLPDDADSDVDEEADSYARPLYDSAVAYSNSWSSGGSSSSTADPTNVNSVDDFLEDVMNERPGMYDSSAEEFAGITGSSAGSSSLWQPSMQYVKLGSTGTTPRHQRTRQRRPSTTGVGQRLKAAGVKLHHVKLATPKRRKNRFKIKRYRI